MKARTVRQVAKLAGVSVRTLHHYDQIGLLQPKARSGSGYRLYGEGELLRLQQIRFFRELGVSLERIKQVLDRPGFDHVTLLKEHRSLLIARGERLKEMVATIDRTIAGLEGEPAMVNVDDLYQGFPKERREHYRKEARTRYGAEAVDATERRLRKLSKSQWGAVQREGEAVAAAMAALMERKADDPDVQAVAARHHTWIENFYPCDADRYRGLAMLYVTSDDFRAFYDKHCAGLADFMKQAMDHFAENALAN